MKRHPPESERWSHWRSVERIRILHVDLSANPGQEASLAREWLSENEVIRWKRFRHERPSRHFAFSRAALRSALCAELGCKNEHLDFQSHRYDKPFALLHGRLAPVSFNLSHSGDHGLIAVVRGGQIGVDVQVRTPGRDVCRVGKSVFGPNELRALRNERGADKDRLFYRLWTLKEALIKALGSGFSIGTRPFEVPLGMLRGANEATFKFPHEAVRCWHVVNMEEERFAAALAYDLTA